VVHEGKNTQKNNTRETHKEENNMNNTTQNLILIILGIIALTTLIQGKDITITTTIIGILGGYLTGKTLTEKQEEILRENNDTKNETDTQ
jgi:hypothetical protein